jgi:rhodanese-related sulfurtransferase
MQKPWNGAVAVVAAVILTGGISGCSTDSSASATNAESVAVAGSTTAVRMGVADFETVLATPGVQIIDVRTPAEFAEGHIRGARNIPVQDANFSEQIAGLDPAGEYAVYCRSGNRSQPAVAAMQRTGISTIYELATGTTGWVAAGKPLA